MRYFDLTDSISQDRCLRKMRQDGNCLINKYNLVGQKDIGNNTEHMKKRLINSNPNLQTKEGEGYGMMVPVDKIDEDSKLRIGNPAASVRGPDRQQLYTRLFKAVPDFSRGSAIPNVDSRLRYGYDTMVNKPCYSLSELQFDRWDVFDNCMENCINKKYIEGIVDTDKIIGLRSRDFKQCQK